MKKNLSLLVLLLFVGATLTAQNKRAEKKRIKAEKAEQDYAKSKALVESGNYFFTATWLTPVGGPEVLLTPTNNFITIEGEKSYVYLPYVGSMQASPGYTAEGGIKHKGEIDNLKVDFDDAKKSIRVNFEADQGREVFEFNLYITKDGFTNLVVTSSRRTSVSYRGEIQSMDKFESTDIHGSP